MNHLMIDAVPKGTATCCEPVAPLSKGRRGSALVMHTCSAVLGCLFQHQISSDFYVTVSYKLNAFVTNTL